MQSTEYVPSQADRRRVGEIARHLREALDANSIPIIYIDTTDPIECDVIDGLHALGLKFTVWVRPSELHHQGGIEREPDGE